MCCSVGCIHLVVHILNPFSLAFIHFLFSSLCRFASLLVCLFAIGASFLWLFSLLAACTSSMIFSWMKINVFRLSVHTKSINPISMQNLYIHKYVYWWACLVHRHPEHSIGNWNVWWYYQSRSHGVYLINSVMCSRVRLNTQNTAAPPPYLSACVCTRARARARMTATEKI